MIYRILTILVLLVPVGCASSFQSGGWLASMDEADYGSYPDNYQTIVKHWYGQHLKEPDSAQFVEITLPKQDAMIIDPFKKKAAYGYSVCAHVKAKNGTRRFTAQQKLLIREGKVVQYLSPQRGRGREYIDPCETQD